jgi:hypothetical protein
MPMGASAAVVLRFQSLPMLRPSGDVVAIHSDWTFADGGSSAASFAASPNKRTATS